MTVTRLDLKSKLKYNWRPPTWDTLSSRSALWGIVINWRLKNVSTLTKSSSLPVVTSTPRLTFQEIIELGFVFPRILSATTAYSDGIIVPETAGAPATMVPKPGAVEIKKHSGPARILRSWNIRLTLSTYRTTRSVTLTLKSEFRCIEVCWKGGHW